MEKDIKYINSDKKNLRNEINTFSAIAIYISRLGKMRINAITLTQDTTKVRIPKTHIQSPYTVHSDDIAVVTTALPLR